MSLDQITGGSPPTESATSVDQAGLPFQADLSNRSAKSLGAAHKDYVDSFATLRVYDVSQGTYVPTQSFDYVPTENNNIEVDYMQIMSLTEVYSDRTAPVYTFGTPLMFTSGQNAHQFVYSGTVLADKITGDNPGRLLRAYENALRVTKMVSPDNPRYVELLFRDQVRRGYITTFATAQNSQSPTRVDFTFTLFATEVFNIDVRQG